MTAGYRPDIDGLRSIAVLLVIVYHAGLKVAPGGYIGVDVFFVISGFLITGIISREVASAVFTFGRFYRRRVLRLMPALFAMLASTSAVAAILLFPSDLVSYAKSAAATATSVGNFFFWREYGGYFGGDAQVVPLLHTWSLAVEEQYYVVWPLLLVGLYRLLGARRVGGCLSDWTRGAHCILRVDDERDTGRRVLSPAGPRVRARYRISASVAVGSSA